MTVDAASTPRFAAGVKFRIDKVRDAWIVLAPERLFLPDESAVEILKLVDGRRSVQAIAEALAERFTAPVDEIARDAAILVQDLAEKGVLEL